MTTPYLTVNDQKIATDKEGYLKHLTDWNELTALSLGNHEGIALNKEHWEIIYLLRDFYQQYEISPAMRILVKIVKEKLGKDKGKSIYLLKLFPQSPARVASKIAGLPRPTNCL